jgi:hypothetical protein
LNLACTDLTDLQDKFYPCLAEVKVTEDHLPFPLRIKVEISKRETKDYVWELKLRPQGGVWGPIRLQQRNTCGVKGPLRRNFCLC